MCACMCVCVCVQSEAEQAKDAGNACVKRGDWQGAIDHYTRAINSDPQLTAALSNRALANLKLGRLEEAVSDCDQVSVLCLPVCSLCMQVFASRSRYMRLQHNARWL